MICSFPAGTEMVYLSSERAALQQEVEVILSGKQPWAGGGSKGEEAPANSAFQSKTGGDLRNEEEVLTDHVRALVRQAMAVEGKLPAIGEPPLVLDVFLGELPAPYDLSETLKRIPGQPKHYVAATSTVSDLGTLDAQAALKWLDGASKALREYNEQEGWTVAVQCAPHRYRRGQFEKMFPLLDSELCNVSLRLRVEPPAAGQPFGFGLEQDQLIDDVYMSGYAMRTVMAVGWRNALNPDGVDPDHIAARVERVVRTGIATSLDLTVLPDGGVPTPGEIDRLYGLIDALCDRIYNSESYTTQDFAFFQDILAAVLGDPPWRRIAVSPLSPAAGLALQRNEWISLDDCARLKPEWTSKPLGCETDRCIHRSVCERRLPGVYYDLLLSGRENLAGRIVEKNCQLVSKYGDKLIGDVLEQCRGHMELSPPLMLVIGDDSSVEYVPMPEKPQRQIEETDAPDKEGPKT